MQISDVLTASGKFSVGRNEMVFRNLSHLNDELAVPVDDDGGEAALLPPLLHHLLILPPGDLDRYQLCQVPGAWCPVKGYLCFGTSFMEGALQLLPVAEV